MPNTKDMMKGFATAAGLLPERLWRGVYALPEEERVWCEEIRVRLGRPTMVQVKGEQVRLRDGGADIVATQEEMDALIAKVTGSSVHTYNSQIARGFVTAAGGHRLGLCGELVGDGGSIITMRTFSSLNLRIAKQVIGIGDEPMGKLYQTGFESTLILSPPGGGKTTLLRDMAGRLSSRYRVSIADERYEIAAVKGGRPQFDLGQCDILSGGSKDMAIDILLRGMAPQIIALDEITREEDATAISRAAHTGCRFLVTAHAENVQDLQRRPIYRALMDDGIFTNVILIENRGGQRQYITTGGMVSC